MGTAGFYASQRLPGLHTPGFIVDIYNITPEQIPPIVELAEQFGATYCVPGDSGTSCELRFQGNEALEPLRTALVAQNIIDQPSPPNGTLEKAICIFSGFNLKLWEPMH